MKIGTLALLVLALGGLTATGTLLSARARLQADLAESEGHRSGLRQELTTNREAQASLEERLGAARAELAETRARTSAQETAASELRRELAEARGRLAQTEQRLNEIEKESGGLREALALSKLEVAQAGADELAAYQGRIVSLEEELAALREQANPVSPAVPAVVLPAAVPIVSVGPDSAFVVLGFGSAQGARTSQVLEIRRGTESVATVLISSVHLDHAIAQVRPDTLRAGLHKGDLATITSPP